METGEVELERALAGDVANTGVNGVTRYHLVIHHFVFISLQKRDTPLARSHDALRWGLRDTLLCGYRSGLAGADDEWPLSEELSSAITDLVQLALIITSDANS